MNYLFSFTPVTSNINIRSNASILNRNTNNPNRIIKYSNYAEIVICNKNNIEIARTKIDLSDVDRCSKLRWGMRANGYVGCRVRNISLHEFIIKGHNTSKLEFDVIDHKDRDILNNRSYNIRILTKSQNAFNKEAKGYYYNKRSNKFVASIVVNGKYIALGSYTTERMAIIARKDAEQEYFYNIKSK